MLSIRKIAAARPMTPILKVFSRKCGVSETKEAGIAILTSLGRARTENLAELIINYAFFMKRNGKAEYTVERTVNLLGRLAKLANLKDPEEVKTVLATLKWKDTTMKMTAYTLKAFYEYLEISYTMPTYKTTRELPFIPTEEELDLLIASGDPTSHTHTLTQTHHNLH